MDIVINFFKSIDGIPYYIILVVNTILIFAIIGYLGEKSNEELMKLGMDTTLPNKDEDNHMRQKPVQVASSSVGLSIPKVSATAVPNPQVNSIPTPNVTPAVGQNVNSNIPVGLNVSNGPIQPTVNAAMNPNNGVNMPSMQTNPSPIISPVPLQNMNQASNPAVPSNSNIQTNEKAPGVLIINSPTSNKDIK